MASLFVVFAATISYPSLASASLANTSTSSAAISGTLKDGLVGWWTFDGVDLKTNVADRSGAGNHGKMQGFGATSTAIVSGKLGQALKFDGVNDYIDVGNAINITSSGLTLAGWMRVKKPASPPDGFGHALIGKDSAYSLEIDDGNGKLHSAIVTSDKAWDYAALSNTALQSDRWYFIAMTQNPATGIQYYLNGVPDGGDPTYTGNISSNIHSVLIGARDTVASRITQGMIDDVRIYSRALSSSEINQLYAMGSYRINQSDDLLSKGLVGWWTFDGADMTTNVADRSGSGNNGKMQGFGATSTAIVSGKIGQALKFDGVNDYVNVGNAINITSSGLTLAGWIRVKNPASPPDGAGHALIGKDSAYSLEIDDGNGKLHSAIVTTDKAWDYAALSNTALASDKWHFIAMTHNPATGVSYYLNGVPDGGDPTYTGNLSSNVHSVLIGARDTVASRIAQGMIDDVRIYNRTLSPAEIEQLYNMGSTKINQPASITATSSLLSGLVNYFSFDGSTITSVIKDIGSSKSVAYFNGIATSSAAAAGKMGQGMDTKNAGLVFASTTALNGSTQYSGSVWVKATKLGTTGAGLCQTSYSILERGSSNAINGYFYLGYGFASNEISIRLKQASPSAAISEESTSDLPLNVWTHIAFTVSATQINLYINGVPGGTPTSHTGATALGNTNATFDHRLNIGACQYDTESISGQFPGQIDEVRLYNRVLTVDEVKRLYLLGR